MGGLIWVVISGRSYLGGHIWAVIGFLTSHIWLAYLKVNLSFFLCSGCRIIMAESSGPPRLWMRCLFCSSMTNEPGNHLRSTCSRALNESSLSFNSVIENMMIKACRFTFNQTIGANVVEVAVRNCGGCPNDLTCVYDLLASLNIKILDNCEVVLRQIRSDDRNRTPLMCLLISELLTGVDGNVVIKPEELIARLKQCLQQAPDDVNTRGSLPPVFCSDRFLSRLPFHLDPLSVSPIEIALLAGNLFAIYALMKVGARYCNEMLSSTLAAMEHTNWEWTVCGVWLHFHVERNKALFIEYVDKIVLLSTKSLAVLASLALSKQVESQEEIEKHLAERLMPDGLISIRKPNFDDDEAYDYTIRGTMKDIV